MRMARENIRVERKLFQIERLNLKLITFTKDEYIFMLMKFYVGTWYLFLFLLFERLW